MNAVVEYLAAVAGLEAGESTLEPGGPAEKAALRSLRRALSDFKAPDLKEKLREVYAREVFFNDTLKTIRTGAQVAEQFERSAAALDAGAVEFLDAACSDGNYYLRWRMSLRFRHLAAGREIATVGMSHIRFDTRGKVVLHQDFWDPAAGLYEHVPALGWAIRTVKRQL